MLCPWSTVDLCRQTHLTGSIWQLSIYAVRNKKDLIKLLHQQGKPSSKVTPASDHTRLSFQGLFPLSHFCESTNTFYLFSYFFSVEAPGVVNCTALRVGPKVITDHPCTTGSSAPGTVCPFTCPHGYKLSGPPSKRCGIDGSWTDEAVPVSCDGE